MTRLVAGEPVGAAPVELDQQPGLGHPVAPAAVARGPAPAGTRPTGRAEQAPQRGPGDDDPVALGEELREVAVIGALVDRRGQLEDPRPGRLGQPVRRRPAPVAVNDRVDAVLDKSPPEPPHRAMESIQQVGHARLRLRRLPVVAVVFSRWNLSRPTYCPAPQSENERRDQAN